MATIPNFVDEFVRNRDEYIRIEKDLELTCRSELEDQKLQFLWQSRVKQAESLRKKLQDRQHKYEDDIQNIVDIKDLVGGRIILTRWKDFGLVENMIKRKFNITGRSQHPKYSKPNCSGVGLNERFRGYDGLHFHVTRQISENDKFSDLVVEIQVISAYTWASQTLSHDYTYKKLNVELSKELTLQFEMFQGISNMGAVALEQLEELLVSDPKSPFSQPSAAYTNTSFAIAEFAQDKMETISKSLSESKQNQKILSWISQIDAESDHDQVRTTLGQPYEDSGQWFRPKFDNLITCPEKRIFWLVGSAGTGKSSLISHVIEWHFRLIQSNKKERLAFFYCSRKKGEKTTALEVLRSLLAQLAVLDNGLSISPAVKNEYEKRRNTALRIQECSAHLVGLINQNQRTTFIVDALDECEDADVLLLHLDHIYKISSETGTPINIFFSSRYDVDVHQKFPDCNKLELEKCQSLTANDMMTYVKTQVRDRETLLLGSRLLKGERPDLERRIVDFLAKNSQGMFQWVKLQLQLFFSPRSRLKHERDVVQKLDSLDEKRANQTSNILDQAYEAMYNSNTETGSWSRTIATRAYKWMMCAQRPLLVSELTEAASINDDGTKEKLTEIYLLQICSNFIISTKENIAQFPHVSVREYLERRETENAKEYSSEQANMQAAVTCLTCLSVPRLQIKNIKTLKTNVLGYSLLHWITHVAAVMPENRSFVLQNLFTAFLIKSCDKFSIGDWLDWLSSLDNEEHIHEKSWNLIKGPAFRKLETLISYEPPNQLLTACIWGVIDMIPRFSSEIKDWGTKEVENSKINTGLFLSSSYGHFDIVKLLIENGAPINTDSFRGTALSAASSKGHKAIVKLLLDAGADVDGTNHSKRIDKYILGPNSALINASYGGHEIIVQMLLDAKANVDTTDRFSQTALKLASDEGHENIVRMLLDAKANVDAIDGDFQTALMKASMRGYKNIVRMLLNANANPDIQDRYGTTALHKASQRGHENVMRMLLKAKADVDKINQSFWTALMYASEDNDENIVRILLNARANTDLQNVHGYTALHLASKQGHENVVRMLLDAGAQADLQTKMVTPLEIISDDGDENYFQRFLRLEADVNAPDRFFETALMIASKNGYENIVRMLLNAGVNTDIQNAHGYTALHLASMQGHENVVHLLLKAGANQLGPALSAARKEGHQKIVQLLLDAGAKNEFDI